MDFAINQADTPIRKISNYNSRLSSSIPCVKGTSIRTKSRVDQLQRLEDMMISIENSLSTVAKKKAYRNFHSDAGSTTSLHMASCKYTTGVGKSNRQKMLQNCHQHRTNNVRLAFTDKDSITLNSEPEMTNVYRIKQSRAEKCKKITEEKILTLKEEIKKCNSLIKSLKLSLEKIDTSTDDIDVKIRQAEVEHCITKEEINLITMLAELQNLMSREEENYVTLSSVKQTPTTIFSCVRGKLVTLHTVQLIHNPECPQFGIRSHEDQQCACVEWCSERSGLMKGDKLLEINGKIVVPAKNLEDVIQFLQSQRTVQIVVMRNLNTIRRYNAVNNRKINL